MRARGGGEIFVGSLRCAFGMTLGTCRMTFYPFPSFRRRSKGRCVRGVRGGGRNLYWIPPLRVRDDIGNVSDDVLPFYVISTPREGRCAKGGGEIS